ncbi:MAG TPA: DedA family protein [Candidatus Saccharimonadales bacterium]|nr:DedA family protein [Candidatus Saccharimonadales bacterium]
MHDLLNPTSLVKEFGYAGVFTALFLESGVVIGFFLPGDSLLFTAGLLASQGYLNIVLLIILSVCAAILGNNVGYYTGKRLEHTLFNRRGSFWFSPKRIKEAHAFFEKEGPLSLVLARFIPAVRTFVPIVAGVGEMRYRTFLIFNSVGGLLWGVVVPILGYTLGRTVHNIDKYLIPIVLFIALVSVIPIVIPYIKKRKNKNKD